MPRLRDQARRASRRALLSGQIADKTTEQLAGAAETDEALQRVAEMLVPRFADHCIIDLFQGDALIRRVLRNAGGWTPPPGAWTQVGEQIRYLEGHLCQQAMARLDTVVVTDPESQQRVAPSARSGAAAREAGLVSALAAPLYARGKLLGVISLATSGLTGRGEHFDTGDREFIAAVASRVSAAIDITKHGSCQSADMNEHAQHQDWPWRHGPDILPQTDQMAFQLHDLRLILSTVSQPR